MTWALRKIPFHQLKVTPFSSAVTKNEDLNTHIKVAQLYAQRIIALFQTVNLQTKI